MMRFQNECTIQCDYVRMYVWCCFRGFFAPAAWLPGFSSTKRHQTKYLIYGENYFELKNETFNRQKLDRENRYLREKNN